MGDTPYMLVQWRDGVVMVETSPLFMRELEQLQTLLATAKEQAQLSEKRRR